MTPAGIIDTGKKVLAVDDEHVTGLEPPVELARGDRQPRHPQPEKHRTFRFVHAVFTTMQRLLNPFHGLVGTLPIERPDDIPGDGQNFAAAHQIFHDHGPDAAHRQVYHGIHTGQRINEIFRRHDYACSYRRQAYLGHRHAENRVLVPGRRGLIGVNHVRERQAIGAVDDQRYPVLLCDKPQPLHFGIRKHVARRISGPRNTDCPDAGIQRECVEIDAVRVILGYQVKADLTSEEAERAVYDLFADPVIERGCVNNTLLNDTNTFTNPPHTVIQAGFKPGVTDC